MKISVRTICFIALFTAVISVLSILSLPTPWGVPFTFQTFAVALAGYVLEAKCGTCSTFLYVLLGFCGLPVYAGMKAGPSVLFGPTGGFLFGFLLLTLFCGLGISLAKKRCGLLWLGLCSLFGLAFCHIMGVIQFRFVMNRLSGAGTYSLISAAAVASLPYLLKDILSLVGAYLSALAIRKALKNTHIADWHVRASQ